MNCKKGQCNLGGKKDNLFWPKRLVFPILMAYFILVADCRVDFTLILRETYFKNFALRHGCFVVVLKMATIWAVVMYGCSFNE